MDGKHRRMVVTGREGQIGARVTRQAGYYACARLLHAIADLVTYDNILVRISTDRSMSDACAELPWRT